MWAAGGLARWQPRALVLGESAGLTVSAFWLVPPCSPYNDIQKHRAADVHPQLGSRHGMEGLSGSELLLSLSLALIVAGCETQYNEHRILKGR